MAGIAILGYGNVGKGTVQVLNKNKTLIERRLRQTFEIRHIYDRADFPGDAMEGKFTGDIDRIFDDNEVDVIVESLGGIDMAFECGARALASGRSFITSNKDLVAARGAELMLIAQENNRSFLFEASVAGGTPVIRPLADNMSADNILRVSGILNGTTNYILSKMEKTGVSYEEALANAQMEGISESDPREDVDGFDAARKLAIMLSIVTGRHVNYRDIPTEGIRGVTPSDINYAASEGYRIKLIAAGVQNEKGFTARVAPMLVPISYSLAGIDGTYNAIGVRCEAAGDLMFIGIGAGGVSTGAAIAADIIDSLMRPGFDNNLFWSEEKYHLAEERGLFTSKAPSGMTVYA